MGRALEDRAAGFDRNRGRYLEPSVCGSPGHAALLTLATNINIFCAVLKFKLGNAVPIHVQKSTAAVNKVESTVTKGVGAMELIFIYGLPGVGKLTVGRELVKLTGYKMFHIHLLADLILSVFEFGTQAFVDLRDVMWPMMIRRAGEEHISGLIVTFVFEETVTDAFVRDIVESVESNGGQVLFVEMQCDRDELARRVVCPDRRRYSKMNSPEKLNELIERGVFHTPTLPSAPLIIDSTRMSPSETARAIFDFQSDILE